MATRDKVSLIVHASEAARPLYLKRGFESLGKEAPGEALVWIPPEISAPGKEGET